MRKFVLLLLALTTLLASCGGSSEAIANLPVAELSASVDTLLTNASKMSPVDGDYIKGMLEIDTASLDEFVLKMQVSGTEIDQYGILKIADGADITSVKTSVETYINTLRTNWKAMGYLPSEQVKLDAAKVEEVGSYIIFTILSSDESDTFFDKIDEMLTSK